VVFGDPVENLTAMCREEAAELLIVGSRGRGPFAAALLGSVSIRLASTAECPVIVVPSPEAAERFLEREPSGCVVCGVDGSPESGRALHVAASLAERMGHELLPVYVDGLGTPENAPASDDAGLQVDVGDPVDGLSWRALGDDGTLIVVGSRGRGALRAAVLGSVSDALAATAPVPVLVVPPTARLTGSADGIADRSVANLLRSAAHWQEDRTEKVALDARTTPGAVLEHEDVGRFSTGNEQLPQTPSKLRRGTFADGYEKSR
jgi:nucleotide-binding universal stress UspA family protein